MICYGPHYPTHISNHRVETVEFGADHLRALKSMKDMSHCYVVLDIIHFV